MTENKTLEWQTYKDCKCGNTIIIGYTEETGCGSMSIDVLNYSGEFRSRAPKWWPNYVYCKACGRRHALDTFKRAG